MDPTFPLSARGSTGPLSMSGNICALPMNECYLEVRGSPAPVSIISYLPNAGDRLCVPQLPHRRLSLWVTKNPEPEIKSRVALNLWSVFDAIGSMTLALMLYLVLRSG